MKAPEGFMPLGASYIEPEHADAVEQAIIKRFDEIVALAMIGKPPVTALIPDLQDLIVEAAYWRLADRCICYALGSKFKHITRVDVPIPLLKRAAVYESLAC